ncbi:MAG: heparinase II/III family protein [Pseudomonadota bacterium]
MSGTVTIFARTDVLRNRWASWRAGRAPVASGFVSQPEPKSIGLYARGKQLVSGNILLSGTLVEAPGKSIWDLATPDPGFAQAAHGFAWLDDLAALGDGTARARAQGWTWDWIARHGHGTGPGWTPDLTGRRIIRWIHHALMLLNSRDPVAHAAYYRSISRQTAFLARRWPAAAPGLPRFEALTGLIYAGLSLTGMEHHAETARTALDAECSREIDSEGGIPTRNPEELLEVFTLLIWAGQALGETGRTPGAAHLAAIERIAPGLRALRHADGGLARFHGGGRGLEGLLDRALASSGVKPQTHPPLAMGFARLGGGRTTVIVDASSPPLGTASATAHASTAAFEMTSGRRPVIVNCGSGVPFGAEWHRAGRATASHSVLSVDGTSSSRFAAGKRSAETFGERARIRTLRQFSGPAGVEIQVTHDGWVRTHGLLASRRLLLSHDGRHLTGEESLLADTAEHRRRFDLVMTRTGLDGSPVSVRFHIHPDVDATLDLGGTAVSLALKSGEIWVFRHDGVAELSLEPSVYLEKGRIKPRPGRQIVLSRNAVQYDTRIGWTLAKAQDTPLAIRDLDRDDFPEPAAR